MKRGVKMVKADVQRGENGLFELKLKYLDDEGWKTFSELPTKLKDEAADLWEKYGYKIPEKDDLGNNIVLYNYYHDQKFYASDVEREHSVGFHKVVNASREIVERFLIRMLIAVKTVPDLEGMMIFKNGKCIERMADTRI